MTPERSIDTPFWTIRAWPDQIHGDRYTLPRGWWFRFGRLGPGLAYKNISHAGHDPHFSERYGRDRSVAVRFGPHIYTFLRSAR